jgi:transcriptional regulator with XRE-family HTH domain
MMQADIARLVGVTELMVCHWERQRYQPGIRFLPKIIKFLGYAPYNVPISFGDWLKQVRSCLGLSQRAFATKTHLDPSTISAWERGDHFPSQGYLGQLRSFLDASRGPE